MKSYLVTLLTVWSVILVRPVHLCNEAENQFEQYTNGNCPSGTSWNTSVSCCTGCPICGPGFRKSPGCVGPCLQCAENYYSSQYDNWKCFPCTVCSKFHREMKTQCVPARDANCGDCHDGYWELPELIEQDIRTQVRCFQDSVKALIETDMETPTDKCPSRGTRMTSQAPSILLITLVVFLLGILK